MNGHSETSKDAQQKARQSRRLKRRQARLSNIEATEESSDEASHLGAGRRIPRDPITRLISLIQFLGPYDNDAEQIESALGDLQQKDERIKSLSATVRELRHSTNEESRIVDQEKDRLKVLQSQLDDKESSLHDAQQVLEQDTRRLREEKERFQDEQQARYDEAIVTEKRRLENESQKQIKKNEKNAASRVQQAEAQILQLKEQVVDLTEAKDDAQRTLTLFKARTKQLEAQQKELESRYQVQKSPLAHFEEDLTKIHQALKTIGHAYFRELPSDDFDIDKSQRVLHDKDPIFQNIPLSASNASKFLRICAAQSVMIKAICHSVWQPFNESMMSLSPGATSIFLQTSKALARHDRTKESLWRSLTMQGLDIAVLQNTDENELEHQLALRETTYLADIFRVMIPQQRQKDFERDLEDLLRDCIRFWNKAKRDSCLIEFDREPPQLCSSGWLPEPCLELDPAEDGSGQEHNNIQSWCLFPRVTFNPINEDPKIAAGSAIFIDCPAFQEGLNELQRREELVAQVKRKFARQPSISKRRQ